MVFMVFYLSFLVCLVGCWESMENEIIERGGGSGTTSIFVIT